MRDVIENGEEVLIFHESGSCRDIKKFIKGKVINSYDSDDLSWHGSPWYVKIYDVLGENGQEYTCTYGHALNFITSYCIKTVDDYLACVQYTMRDNKNKIEEIRKHNKVLLDIKNSLLEGSNIEENSKILKKEK